MIILSGAGVVETPALGTPFFTSAPTGPTVRNDFTGFVGCRITVGASPITVTDLGRLWLTGNSDPTNEIRIVRVTGTLTVASANVSLASGVNNQYNYTAITPVTLLASTQYYIVAEVVSGGTAAWREFGTPTKEAWATLDAPAFSSNGGVSYSTTGSNATYVYVNFKGHI